MTLIATEHGGNAVSDHPTAILTADIHLRDDQPVCRKDVYWEAQHRKIKWLRELQEEYRCPILCAGDLTHRWNCSPYLLGWAIEHLPFIYTVAGQHDLPQHAVQLYSKSGLHVLERAGRVRTLWTREGSDDIADFIIDPFPWGAELRPVQERVRRLPRVAICHHMTWPGKVVPYPNPTGDEANALLERMKGYDLILTGDNHMSFAVEQEGRWLVNPGSLMRMTADQADHEPSVVLWYAKDRMCDTVYAPFKKDVVSREHLERAEARDERLAAFVDRLGDVDFDGEMNFTKNVERFLDENDTTQGVRECVWKAMEAK